ncbi:hypothetical protein NEOKW01_0239 [Nematocida sp. AWRm80]|nr:hypothetical protein NEOKW01_0239 [Nematocida sp. AWRm80]
MQMKRTIEDIDATVKEMDCQYDANFGEWVRSEENLEIIVANFKKYLHQYTEQTFSEVLKWIVTGWKTSTRIVLLKKLLSKQLFRDNTPSQLESSRRIIRIIKSVIENWSPAQVSELIIEFLADMKKEEKRVFLLWLLEDFTHHKLTEIFIRIDNIVDWSLKISIIKNSKVLRDFKNNNPFTDLL